MAFRKNYESVTAFAAICAANTDRQIYAIRKNVTTGNPDAQSFAVGLIKESLPTVGNKCIDLALAGMFDNWRFEYVKARFQDLPDGSEIDDGHFDNGQIALAYLESLEPKSAEKLSAERITAWFDACTQLHDALHNVLARHNLSVEQSENQFKKFLHGLKKLAKKGSVSKKLATEQQRLLVKVAGISPEDGITERLILSRLDGIINEVEEDSSFDLFGVTLDGEAEETT